MAGMLKCHPNVDAVIRPIMEGMTELDIRTKMNPIAAVQNENDQIKKFKRQCVHFTFKNGMEPCLRTKRNSEGVLVCEVCNRPIYTKFDDTAIQKITDCISVINQILLFGLMNGLMHDRVQLLISLKCALPEAAVLSKQLNDFVKRDNSSADSADNLGAEYLVNGYRSITEMG